MSGRLQGKVAFISGAARGQGRAHAVRLAEEGADIIAFDAAGPVPSQGAPAATPEDLDETVRQVEKHNRRILARRADASELDAVTAVLDEGLAEFGRVDIVVANAGVQGNPARSHRPPPRSGAPSSPPTSPASSTPSAPPSRT
jgi:(+)-trans-carveol dehydrogenase